MEISRQIGGIVFKDELQITDFCIDISPDEVLLDVVTSEEGNRIIDHFVGVLGETKNRYENDKLKGYTTAEWCGGKKTEKLIVQHIMQNVFVQMG
jgi:hypothetical protein